MITLAGSGDITAALEGSITSLLEKPGNQSLLKLWRQHVIQINVVRRFTRTYSAKSFQCDIAPGLSGASPQAISKVKKSNTSEGSETRHLSTGAHFSPNSPIQDEPKQKFKSEKKNVEGYSFKLGDVFKDHRVLSPIQILVTGLTSQIKEADLLGRRIIVTVIDLASRQEGTTATDNHVVWTALKRLLFLLWWSTFEIYGANAQDVNEDGKRECPNERVDLPYIVQAACTILAGIIMIAVIARRINRPPPAAPPAVRPLAADPPALPAAPLAVRPPANAPVALPVVVAVPPAVVVPANAIGFVDVMAALVEDSTPPKVSDLKFRIHDRLQED